MISDVWGSLGGYGDSGFPSRPEKLSAFNVFMSLNLPNAIDLSGDVPAIDYSLLKIAKGSLPCVDNVKATVTAEGITLEGETLADSPKAQSTDIITVLLKKVNGAVKAVRLPRGIEADFSLQFALPGISAADIEFVYVVANSNDGKKASNSLYVALT